MFRIIEMNEDFNQLKKGIKSLKPCGIFKKTGVLFIPHVKQRGMVPCVPCLDVMPQPCRLTAWRV